MSHVNRTLAMRPLCCLSSLHAPMITILSCSRKLQSNFTLPKTGASHAVAPNLTPCFHLPTSFTLLWMPISLNFHRWTHMNLLRFSTLHMLTTYAIVAPLWVTLSFSAVTPSPTDARHSLSLQLALLKQNSLLPSLLQSMLAMFKPS